MGNDLGAKIRNRLAENLEPAAHKRMETCKILQIKVKSFQ